MIIPILDLSFCWTDIFFIIIFRPIPSIMSLFSMNEGRNLLQ